MAITGKNRKKALVIGGLSLLLLVAISFGFFSWDRLSLLKDYLNKRCYDEAVRLIDNPFMKMPILKEQSQKAVLEKIDIYRITGVEDFTAIDGEQWEEIRELSDLVVRAGWDKGDSDFSYICDLYELRTYRKISPAVRWMNSLDYEKWKAVRSNNNLNGYAAMLRRYSFSEYTQGCSVMLRMEELTKQLANAVEETLWYAEIGDSTGLYWAKQESKELLADLADIEVNILLEKAELEEAISKLID